MKTCKRGGIGPRDKYGHCLCAACLQYAKEYRANNPRKEYQKRWRRLNPDKCASYTKKWNMLHRKQRREIEKSWKDRNPEKARQYNQKARKKWHENNRSRRNAINAKRRAAQLLRFVTWADADAIAAIYKTAKMLTVSTGIPHEVDHIYPLQGKTVSGLHVHNNLQILTRTENRRKGIKCAA